MKYTEYEDNNYGMSTVLGEDYEDELIYNDGYFRIEAVINKEYSEPYFKVIKQENNFENVWISRISIISPKYIKTEIHQSARRIYELEESGKKKSEYKNYRIELIEMVCTKRWEDFNKIFVKDVQGIIFFPASAAQVVCIDYLSQYVNMFYLLFLQFLLGDA